MEVSRAAERSPRFHLGSDLTTLNVNLKSWEWLEISSGSLCFCSLGTTSPWELLGHRCEASHTAQPGSRVTEPCSQQRMDHRLTLSSPPLPFPSPQSSSQPFPSLLHLSSHVFFFSPCSPPFPCLYLRPLPTVFTSLYITPFCVRKDPKKLS